MKIKVCKGKTCSDRFSEYITTRLQNEKEKFNLNNLEIEETLCLGKCKTGPNIVKDKEVLGSMNPIKAAEIANPNVYKKKKK